MVAGLAWILANEASVAAQIPGPKFVETLGFILSGMALYAISALLTGAVRLGDLRGLARQGPVD